MNKTDKLLIIGGDSRQLYMADYLESLGFKISIYGLPDSKRKNEFDLKSAIEECDGIIFPLPISKDGKYPSTVVPIKETLDEMLPFITAEKPVFGGMINRGIKSKFEKRNIKIYDYFEREDVTVMNTIPTAQGILKTLIDNIEYTIHSSKCAVFGFGRVARVTADVLKSVGANVTVCARKNGDLASANVLGMESCKISEFYKIAHEFNIIINTVPSVVIDRKILKNVRPDCLIIDVASAPFGTDFAAACELGLNAMQCSSLPGKVAPKTAGKIIADGILNIIMEEQYG